MMRRSYLSVIPILIFSLTSITPVLKPKQATAISGSNWLAGRIIDDTVFTNKNAMTVGEIQAFLNAHVGQGGYDSVPGQCDTYGARNAQPYSSSTRAQYAISRGYPAVFTCLKDYYEVPKTTPGPGIPASNYGGAPIPVGAKSAAQLIWDAAQANNISPKVLLVTIQKESAGPLTTDDWPFQKQYTYAMGAHCPDSGPGGTANCDPNYAGFSIQISESAALLRWYLDNMYQPWWAYKKPGSNAVLYHPNAACGSSNVFIETMATAALYTYTPYQPNQAALNNLYGTGDGCSSYGNRNFWRIYYDWFGSPYGLPRDGTLESSANTGGWLEYGETRTVTVAARNIGSETWCADGFCPAGKAPTRLVSQNFNPLWLYDPTDPAWITSAQVKMQTPSVAPNEVGYFVFKLRAPYAQIAASNRFFVLIAGTTFAQSANVWVGGNTYPPPMSITAKTVTSNTVLPNQKVLATVKILNTSKSIWYSDAGRTASQRPMRLCVPGYVASPYYDASDPAWLTSSQIAMKTPVVNPGEEATFEFSLRGPFQGLASYNLKFLPVIDGLTALPDIGATFALTTPNPSLTYSFVSASPPPATMSPGTTAPKVTITLKNTGNTVWRNETAGPLNRTRLYMIFPRYRSSPFYDASDPAWLTSSQIAMKTPVVNPGEDGVFEFGWKAPLSPGNYLEYFSLVMDGYNFFPDYGSAFRTIVQ